MLAERQRHGPLAVQRPFYPEGEVCHVYLLHPPGGVVGGDSTRHRRAARRGRTGPDHHPGCDQVLPQRRAARARPSASPCRTGARLEWLPQENIFFPGAEVGLETQVELQGDARLALWEIQCLGRPVIGEGFDRGHIDSRLQCRRDGVAAAAGTSARGRRQSLTAVADGGRCRSAVPGDQRCRRGRRSRPAATCCSTAAPDYAGATLIDDLLVVRYLGDSTERARRLFTDIWQTLRAAPWAVRPACRASGPPDSLKP